MRMGIAASAVGVSLIVAAIGCGGPVTEPAGFHHKCQAKITGYYKFGSSTTHTHLRISDNPAAKQDFDFKPPGVTGKFGCGPGSTVTFRAKTTVNRALSPGGGHKLTCAITVDGHASSQATARDSATAHEPSVRCTIVGAH